MSTDQPVVLITGASSGFGHATAQQLLQHGYRVFGTSRRPQVRRSDTGVTMVVLDVRSDASVQQCVAQVLAVTGRIDVLVNNAGLLQVGPAEESTLDDAQMLLDTNFFGVVRMTNAVLPGMRQQRQGRIINISSLAGLVAVPGEAVYSASKFALEGYSEALRYEVAPLGIQVVLVEPGFFQTNMHAATMHPVGRIADYDRLRATIAHTIQQSIAGGADPKHVAQVIGQVARARRPQFRYRVGTDAQWVPRVKQLLPEPLFTLGIRKRFKLP